MRSVTVVGSAAASRVGRRVEDLRDLAAGRARWPAGARARSRPRPRPRAARAGSACGRRSPGRPRGADGSSRCSPASVTASVYSVPAASSDSALASSAHDASTTGRSARLRRSTADQRPSGGGQRTFSRREARRASPDNNPRRPERFAGRRHTSPSVHCPDTRRSPMTVAAVILAASPASALADADGTPGVRRLADVAWSGGATPVVVCSFDPDGAVAAALANTEATLVDPVRPEHGPVGQIVERDRGRDPARRRDRRRARVAGAARLGRRRDGHDADRGPRRRPRQRHPARVATASPAGRRCCRSRHLDALRALGATRMPDELLDDLEAAGVPFRIVETGDPGVTHDVVDAARRPAALRRPARSRRTPTPTSGAPPRRDHPDD